MEENTAGAERAAEAVGSTEAAETGTRGGSRGTRMAPTRRRPIGSPPPWHDPSESNHERSGATVISPSAGRKYSVRQMPALALATVDSFEGADGAVPPKRRSTTTTSNENSPAREGQCLGAKE